VNRIIEEEKRRQSDLETGGRGEDEKVRKCEDVKMRGCEGFESQKVRRFEG